MSQTRKDIQSWVENIQEKVAKKVGFCDVPWWDNDHNPIECKNCNVDWEAWNKFWQGVYN